MNGKVAVNFDEEALFEMLATATFAGPAPRQGPELWADAINSAAAAHSVPPDTSWTVVLSAPSSENSQLTMNSLPR